MLAIIWHSRTGAARAMAEAACAGGGAPSGARLVAAEAAFPADLLAATGLLFCGPENLGALSGAMKEMFDRCYYPLLGRIEGKPYAAMIAAGSDGSGALRQLQRIVTGWRLREVATPLIVNMGAQTEAEILAPKIVNTSDLEQCRQLGAAMVEGMRLGIF